jgi:hypothetical protein
MDKKRKGGAEKSRLKKKLALVKDAKQSKQLTDIFLVKPSLASQSPLQHASIIEDQSVVSNEGGQSVSFDILSATYIKQEQISQGDSQSVSSQSGHENFEDHIIIDEPTVDVNESGKEDDNEALAIDTRSDASFFERPVNAADLNTFFAYHPQQPLTHIPFNPTKVYRRSDTVSRQWLTFSSLKKQLFCSVCLAYSKSTESNAFITGLDDWRHIYQRIEEHENSKMHANLAEAHVMRIQGSDIVMRLFNNAQTLRNEQVMRRRKVLHRVIDTIVLIGKRGLSYKSHYAESAYRLADDSLDHGNFLELLQLLAKYDDTLRLHLDQVISASKERHDNVGVSQGRRSLITMISKTMVNYVVTSIRQLIQRQIADDVKDCGIYSVQLDTTQDITVTDQCSVVIRYVSDVVNERLIAFPASHSSTGKHMFEMLEEIISSHGLDITKCVSDSTDGAANMSGAYNGFTAWLERSSPNHIHVWCYAHVLNLVMSDTTACTTISITLFGLVHTSATFLSESYLRMNCWKSNSVTVLERRN